MIKRPQGQHEQADLVNDQLDQEVRKYSLYFCYQYHLQEYLDNMHVHCTYF